MQSSFKCPLWASLVAQLVKNPPAMPDNWIRFLGWEDPPGEGKGYPLQYSSPENSMNCIDHGVTKGRTRLSDFHFHFKYETVTTERKGNFLTQDGHDIL